MWTYVRFRRWLLLTCLLTCAGESGLAPPLRAQEQAVAPKRLILVENGVSRAPIVVFRDAPPFIRQAASELATYIEKVSGAKPEVVEGLPDPLPDHAIFVGYQPKLKDLFPGINFEFQHPEEILIAANANYLVIAGRDRWHPDHLVVEGRRGKVVGKQQEYGTVNAVYTFLQDYVGVRWLWPGELGEDVPKQETIAFSPFEYRYHPQIRSRSGVFHFSALLTGPGYGRSQDWVRFQRLQLDSLEIEGGHAFTDWWDRFHETHPEYFALQPDGTRSGFPDARTAKLCHSNMAVAEQWLACVEEQLQKDPNKTVFNASPNDGWASGHCVCENCRAWDHPDGEPRLFHWQGLAQEYVALSDRDVTFANRCARLLKERYPDKDYYVQMVSYGHSRPAPIKAIPADNVIISSVANFFLRTGAIDRGSTRGTTYQQQFEDWAKVAPHLVWRPNTGSPAGWQQGQPDVPLTQTMKDWRYVAERKCLGIFIDSVWEHWATQGPLYYLIAQLTWNPWQDGQAILDDYYRRGFGKAADYIKAYWELLEKAREEYVQGDGDYPRVYSQALFDQGYRLLDQASAALAGEPEIYQRRVGFVRAGLDYTRLVIELRALTARLRESGGKDAEADRQARANWAEMERIAKEHPYAINWGPVRPSTERMQGLHPDYLAGGAEAEAAGQEAPKPRPAAPTTKLVPAEEAGWRLVFRDDFRRDQLGPAWKVIDGNWALEDGCLRGSGTIISSQGFPAGEAVGFQRLEFEAATDVRTVSLGDNAPQPKPRVSDLSAFIHAQPPEVAEKPAWDTGYFFQFGGLWNTRNQLRSAGIALVIDPEPKMLITPGKTHRIVAQNDRGHLSFFVDGRLLLEHDGARSLAGPEHNRIGFYFYTAAKVLRVSVYVKE